MMHDCTVFWQSNERACHLFYALLARAERGEYDDDFLAALASYRKESPDAENADIFAARYLLHHDDTAAALVCAERAYRRRPVHYEI